MSSSAQMQVIAIDGGGTRCRLAFDRGGETVVVEAGAANVSTDFDGTVHALTDGLGRLAERTGLTPDALAAFPVFAGLAGVTGSGLAGRLAAALPFARIRIEDDRRSALRGALGRAEGLIAHCGTGSFLAAQIGGEVRLAGGWGHVLGDEASAFWIGREALRVTLDVVDGLCAPSALSERLLADHAGAPGIVRFAGTRTPPEVGALAPVVTTFAADGEVLARRVMQAGADYITRTLTDLGWTPGRTICLTGGIGPQYRTYLPAAMQADLAPPKGEPLAGAIDLARDFAQEAPA